MKFIGNSNLKPHYLLVIVLVCLWGWIPVPPAWSQNPKIPFHPGERLTYHLKWEVFSAGEAVLEVLPFETFEGVRAYHFVMTTKTNSFIDKFYKVRDQIDAFADAGMTRSLSYRKQQKEGRHERDVVIRFDWKAKTAQYSNFGDPRDPIPIEEGAFDPLSALFFIRMFELRENMVLESPVTDGKKCIKGKANILEKETVVMDKQSYETYRIEPEMEHIGGVFEKSPNAKLEIWITADDWKIPVRIRSKVAVGSFIGELISAQPGKK
jgi:hypothetical protein